MDSKENTQKTNDAIAALIKPVLEENPGSPAIVTIGNNAPDSLKELVGQSFIAVTPGVEETVRKIADTRFGEGFFDEVRADAEKQLRQAIASESAEAKTPSSNTAAAKEAAPKRSSTLSKLTSTALMAGAMFGAQAAKTDAPGAPSRPDIAAVATEGGFTRRRRKEGKEVNHAQAGFTLTELIVSISIMSVLAAITLPAVQNARDAAREMAFKNNLKQVGLALQNFREINGGKYPYSVEFYDPQNPTQNINQEQGGIAETWAVKILPFVDQAALKNQFDEIKGNPSLSATDKQTMQDALFANTTLSVFTYPGSEKPGRMDMAGISGAAWAATDPGFLLKDNWVKYNGVADNAGPWPQEGRYNTVMPRREEFDAQTLKWVKQEQTRMISKGESNTPVVIQRTIDNPADLDPTFQEQPVSFGMIKTGKINGGYAGESHVVVGGGGNVRTPDNWQGANKAANTLNPHSGKWGQYKKRGTHALYADGHVGYQRPTGEPGSSDATSAPTAVERLRKEVQKDSDVTPEL